ncbi:MAG: phenylacetate--CoA ligase family protein [Desulfococcaceae bacterium]
MSPIAARTAFYLQERLLGRNTFPILKELEESQWWSDERLENLRSERLRNIVHSAYQHSSYWRGLMDEHGISPRNIQTAGDLKTFPFLEKQTLRSRREDMVWKGAGKRIQLIRTSGSTNEALQFYTNSDREAHINAARIRGHRWMGMNIGEKEGYFWGAPVELSKQDRIKKIRDFLINNMLLSAMVITPETVPRYLEEWKKWKPKCLFGYPSSFVLVAQIAGQNSIDLTVLRKSGLKMICTTSEILGGENRKIIHTAFGVPVFDSYGVREGGLIGHECSHQTMHCVDEQLILETIDPETLLPTQGEGELVVSNLVGTVMPVIRYRTGDIVTLSREKCGCGRTLSSIKISGGRQVDSVVSRNGKWIIGYAFIYICRSVKGIVKFQVLQEHIGTVRVLLVTDRDFPDDGKEQVKKAVQARMKSDDEIIVETADDIAPSPSGKYRPVISKVAEELRAAGRIQI